MIPVVTMPIESEKAIFRFSCVFMAFSEGLATTLATLIDLSVADTGQSITLRVRHLPIWTSGLPFSTIYVASSAALLSSYQPDIALISAGRGNLFGHPASDVLARLAAAGAEIFRTDRDAAVLAETDGRRVSVRAMRGRTWDVRMTGR